VAITAARRGSPRAAERANYPRSWLRTDHLRSVHVGSGPHRVQKGPPTGPRSGTKVEPGTKRRSPAGRGPSKRSTLYPPLQGGAPRGEEHLLRSAVETALGEKRSAPLAGGARSG
jgi:hypothetical protein